MRVTFRKTRPQYPTDSGGFRIMVGGRRVGDVLKASAMVGGRWFWYASSAKLGIALYNSAERREEYATCEEAKSAAVDYVKAQLAKAKKA